MNRVVSVLCGLLLGVSTCLGLVSSAAAQTPPGLLYEGRLTYDGGVDPVEGEVVMTFGVFLEADGGEALWTSTLPVEVVAGDFVAELGAAVPMPAGLFNAGPRFLGVTVGAGDTAEELLPRQRIGAAPFALGAAQANGLSDAALADLGTRMVDAPEFQALRDAVATPTPTLEDVTGGVFTSELVVQAGAAGLPSRFGNRDTPETRVLLDVPDRGVIEALEIALDIAHLAPTQLIVELATPWGETVTLHNRRPGDPTGLLRTYPIPGAAGRPLAGRYTLRVTDRVEDGVTGTVGSFTVRATVRSVDQVSTTGRLGVGGPLLAGGTGAGAIGDVLHSTGNGAPAWGRVTPGELSATGCTAGQVMKVRDDGLGWECSTPISASYFGATETEVGSGAPDYDGSISMAIGRDGLPVIVYFADSGDLMVVKCGNAMCSAGNRMTAVDSMEHVPWLPRSCSVAIGWGDWPVVAYLDSTNDDLKILKCGNVECSAGNVVTTVDSVGDVGSSNSIAVNENNYPVVSYLDLTNNDLKLLTCGDSRCTAGNRITTVDSVGDVGLHTSITLVLGAVFFPVLSYFDARNADLKYAVCGNATCTFGNTVTTLDAEGGTGTHPSIELNEWSFPSIAYAGPGGAIKVIHCADLDCSQSRSTATIDTIGEVGGVSMAIHRRGEASNLPLVAYIDGGRGLLKVAACGDTRCSANNSINVLSRAGRVSAASIKIGADDLPVVAYIAQGLVKVAHCSNPYCIDLRFGH